MDTVEQDAVNALLREIVLRALESIADDDGMIRADRLVVLAEIMNHVSLSDGGEDE